MSIMQSLMHSKRNSVNLVASNTTTSSFIQIPPSPNSIAGDLAILFDTARGSTTTPPSTVVQSGWTVISNQSESTFNIFSNTSIRSIVSYRFLTSGNPGSNINGMSGQSSKILLVFRPNFTATSISFLPTPALDDGISGNSSATHELALSQDLCPIVLITHGSSTGLNDTTLNVIGNSTNEVSSTYSRVKYAIFNSNEQPNDVSITLTANVPIGAITSSLQSFFIKYT